MQIHERIKALRERRGLSQEALALAVGYRDRSSIAKVETGKVDLSQSKIAAFAKALGVTPAALLGWEETHEALGRAGLSLADVAEEMGLPVEALETALRDGSDPAAICAVANALVHVRVPVDFSATPREAALVLLYRAASSRDRAVVDTILGLESVEDKP